MKTPNSCKQGAEIDGIPVDSQQDFSQPSYGGLKLSSPFRPRDPTTGTISQERE